MLHWWTNGSAGRSDGWIERLTAQGLTGTLVYEDDPGYIKEQAILCREMIKLPDVTTQTHVEVILIDISFILKESTRIYVYFPCRALVYMYLYPLFH